LDKIASLCIYGKIETIVENVMRKLSLDIPRWKIIRRIKFIYENHSLKIKSLDLDGKPFSICKKVIIFDKSLLKCTETFEVAFVDRYGNKNKKDVYWMCTKDLINVNNIKIFTEGKKYLQRRIIKNVIELCLMTLKGTIANHYTDGQNV
jgi:hypothetical protein